MAIEGPIETVTAQQQQPQSRIRTIVLIGLTSVITAAVVFGIIAIAHHFGTRNTSNFSPKRSGVVNMSMFREANPNRLSAAALARRMTTGDQTVKTAKSSSMSLPNQPTEPISEAKSTENTKKVIMSAYGGSGGGCPSCAGASTKDASFRYRPAPYKSSL